MLPDRVSKPGPLTYESGALPTALHGPALRECKMQLSYLRQRHYLTNTFVHCLYVGIYFSFQNNIWAAVR